MLIKLSDDQSHSDVVSSKRKFIKQLAGGALVAMAGINPSLAGFRTLSPHKTLALEHSHTGEKLKLTYYENGRYIKPALKEISYLLRDYNNDHVHTIDPFLLDQLYDLSTLLGTHRPFYIISGYRSPVTNAVMRKHHRGIAKDSLHMQGRAIDIQIEGIDARRIRNAAVAMQSGGVGYYRQSEFVHLDTGNVRTW
ncbi:MAG: Twin-arginine translocation pathway signal [Methylobacter sp.]|nr:MAG: Twin-arginine translocation pathway signal [Methylobacter sp.]PPD18021.1 MAG: Twin-arginine translocation pathway signal [Methylobacter sp.]